MRVARWTTLGALVGLLVVGSACGSKYIDGEELYGDQPAFRVDEEAEIPDETETRKALDVLARYRRSLVEKDFGALKKLISEEYYDNAGTTSTTGDDYGREQLVDAFERLAQHAQDIEYRVTVKDVTFERDRALVRYEYEYAYKFDVTDKPSWDAGVEVNQLVLEPTEDDWKIVSGL